MALTEDISSCSLISGELSSLQSVVVPLRKENARLVRESNALHGELLRKAEQHFDADAAERDAHVSTRRALTEARYLLKKHKIPFGYDEGAADAEVGANEDADAAALRLRVGELEARRADDEKVRDRLVFLAEERERELARLNGLVASGARRPHPDDRHHCFHDAFRDRAARLRGQLQAPRRNRLPRQV